jgi:hypothetical protein
LIMGRTSAASPTPVGRALYGQEVRNRSFT